MVQKDFLEKTALVCGLPLPAVEEVFHAMTSVLGGALAEGETVDLSATFGKFTPQLRVQKLAPNSPRTPKKPHYYICFRPGKMLEKRLRINAVQGGGDGE